MFTVIEVDYLPCLAVHNVFVAVIQ